MDGLDSVNQKDRPDWVDSLPENITLETLVTWFILETIEKCNGNRTKAAKKLNISIRGIRLNIKKYEGRGYDIPKPERKRFSNPSLKRRNRTFP